jgi:Spy/CpxP family protein refolding chaperone
MKKVLLIAFLLAFTAGMASAQQQGGPGTPPGGPGAGGQGGQGNHGNFHGGNHGNPVERLTERLGLDEAQAAAIALIFEDTQQLRDEERERTCAAAEEIRANTHAQIMEVLTLEQQALFEEQQQKRLELMQALQDAGAEHGFGGGHNMRGCGI